jgi:hypothetical protein
MTFKHVNVQFMYIFLIYIFIHIEIISHKEYHDRNNPLLKAP